MPMETPPYFKPKKPNMQRRATWHDYRGRMPYMITMVKSHGIPALAELACIPSGTVVSRPTQAGMVPQRFLCSMMRFHQALRIWKYVIMPDHIHFLLFVEKQLEKHVGIYLGMFKTECTNAWHEMTGSDIPFFQEGYHDRIIGKNIEISTIKAYIGDNPRRLWLKQNNPQLFGKIHKIEIGGEELRAFGNIFLLNDFEKEAVRISSRFSADELHRKKLRWLYVIENGGVLVSPFISQAERAIRDYAIENGGRLIVIQDNGFTPRFKPTGRMFDLCCQGRLLLVAPAEYSTTCVGLTRAFAMRLNSYAENISCGRFRLYEE